MNSKISKILMGFSAMAVAGILSIIPATNVFAGEYSSTSIYYTYQIDEYDYSYPESFSGNVNYTYSNNGATNVVGDLFFVAEYLNGNLSIASMFGFDDDIPLNTIANAEFDFVFNGTEYRGSIDLTTIMGSTLMSEEISLSQFAYAPSSQPSNEFTRSIDNKVNEIVKAAQGINNDGSENPQKVVFYNYNGAVSYRIIQALAKTQGVTLLYTFEYQGYVFTSAITSEMAAQIFIEGEDWYGPCYIAKHCPTVLVDVVK